MGMGRNFALLSILFVLESVSAEKYHGFKTANKSVDSGTWKAPIEIQKDFPYSFLGFDYEHRRVYYIGYGRFQTRKYVEGPAHDLENVRLYFQLWLDRMFNDGKKYGHPDDNHIDEVVLIYDWDEMNLLQLSSERTLKFLVECFEHFRKLEGILAYGFFINVNTLAETTISLFKPLLGNVHEKIEVYGTIKSRWVPQLLRKIPSDQLPEILGGSNNQSLWD